MDFWIDKFFTGRCALLQINYWQNQLAGAPDLLALPTPQGRPQVTSGEGVNIPFDVSPDLLCAVRQLAQANGCTLIMFFTAAYQVRCCLQRAALCSSLLQMQ